MILKDEFLIEEVFSSDPERIDGGNLVHLCRRIFDKACGYRAFIPAVLRKK